MRHRLSSHPFKKTLKIAIIIVLLAFFFVPAFDVYAAEKKPATYIKNATSHVVIAQDGSVQVSETIHFHFGKSKKSLQLPLVFPIEGETQLNSFEIAHVLDNEEDRFISVPAYDETRPQPFSYKAVRLKDRLRIDLSMTSFLGDYIFRLDYVWTRGVIGKDNRALIAGPLCVAPNNMMVETLSWTISLPHDCAIDLSEIVPIAYHTLTENKTSPNVVSYVDNQSFTKTEGMGIAISAPKRCFPLILPASDSLSLQETLNQARSLSARLTQVESLRESVTRIIIILTVAGLLSYASFQVFWTMWKRRTSPDFALWTALTRPAQIASLMSFNPKDANLLLATLLSLVTRREISWTDEVFIWNNPNRNDFSQFTTYETLLLQWLFISKPEYDNVLSPERLRVAARQDDFRQLAQRFKKQIEADFNKSGLIEPRWTKIFKFAYYMLSLLFLALTAGLYFYTTSPLAFVMLLVSALFAMSGLTFRFKTAEGARHFHEIRRFKRSLKTPILLVHSVTGQLTDVEILIGTLPLAVALNKASDYLWGIKELDPPQFGRAAYALLHVYRGMKAPANIEAVDGQYDPYEQRLLWRAIDEMERVLASWRELFGSCFL